MADVKPSSQASPIASQVRNAQTGMAMATPLLKEELLRLSTAFQMLNDSIVIIDLKGTIIEANDTALAMRGLSHREELVGKNAFDLIAPEDRERARQNLSELIIRGKVQRQEYRSLLADGTIISNEISAALLKSSNGHPLGIVVVTRDITERKHVETNLRRIREELEHRVSDRTTELKQINDQLQAENRERQQTERVLRHQSRLLQAATEAAHHLLTCGDFQTAMSNALATLGNAAQIDRAYIFKNHHDPTHDAVLLTSQQFEWVREPNLAQIDNPQLQHFPFSTTLPRWYQQLSDGQVVGGRVRDLPSQERTIFETQGVLSLLLVPIYTSDELWGFIGFDDCTSEREWSDGESTILLMVAGCLGARITRQHADEALRKSDQRFRLMVENLLVGALYREGEHIFFNRAVEQFTGYTNSEISTLEQWFQSLYGPQAIDVRKMYEHDRALNFPQSRVVPFIHKDGQPRHAEFSAYKSELGELWLFRDVTEHKRTEEALRTSEERWQLAARGVNDGIWDWNLKTNFVFFSPSMKEIMGFADDELANDFPEWQSRIHPEDLPLVKQALDDHFTKKVPFYTVEYRLRCKDGHDKWVLARGRAVWDAQGNAERIVGALTDLTERKQAETQLHLAEQIISETDNLVLVANIKGQITYANRAVSRALGYTTEEILGDGWLTLTRSESHEQEQERNYLAMAARDDERRITTTYERQVKDKNGNSRWILWQDTKGPQGLLIGIGADITQRKADEQELQVAKEAAEAASRAKSQFLANMSHEIRTPMNGVLGMTELLLGTPLNEKQRRFADAIHNSAESLLNIINDILDFSKIEAGKLELEHVAFDVRQAIEDIADLFAQRAQAKGLEIACLIHSDVPTALQGDPHRLRQVLTNLVSNAIKFTDHGEVVIEVSLEPQARDPELHETLRDASLQMFNERRPILDSCTLRFSVRDTGIGLQPEVRAKLFQPFIQADGSTTRKYGGTGLGLAISKQIVHMMHGQIDVESHYGSGSTFWFTAQFEKQAGTEQRPDEASKAFHSTRVLIVDDNSTNRDILHHQLHAWGLRDDRVDSGVQALQFLYKAVAWKDPYTLAILDMHMPGMDGIALAHSIKSDPALSTTRLIMLTSAGQYGDAEAAYQAGIEAYMSKPVRQSELYNCLATLIEGKTTSTIRPAADKHTTTASHQEPSQRHGKLRILLAEDNPVNQEVAGNMLENLGYHVDIVANGRAAMEAVQHNSYALVFMDCQMPEMDGFEATAAIRRSEQPQHRTTIIALTANAMDGDEQRCRNAGMDDYLSKPFSQEKLRTMIERWVLQPLQSGAIVPETGSALVPDLQPSSPSLPVTILDGDVLTRLQELQRPGKPDVLRKLITTYLTDSPTLMAKVQQAITQNNAVLLRESAHSLKGSSAMIGATLVTQHCRDLEYCGREQQLTSALVYLKALETDYATTHTALNSILSGTPIQEAATLRMINSQPTAAPADHPQAKARILLVEDNLVNQLVALGVLEGLGYEVEVASDGRAGVDAFTRSVYDAILMDCQMPELDGYEATRIIRQREAAHDSSSESRDSFSRSSSPVYRHIPIIALTANIGTNDRAKCLAAGMDDYLGKPYTQEQLQRALERWIPLHNQVTRSAA